MAMQYDYPASVLLDDAECGTHKGHISWASRRRNRRQTRTDYELIERPGASKSSSAPDWRCSFPVHVVRGVCDSVFRLARRRTIGAYVERAVRPHPAGIWPAMAQAPPRRRAFTYRILVSVYSGLAITAAFFLAATWGAGQSLMPLSGAPRGTAVQEAVITAVSYSSAPTGIIAFALILWGLRNPLLGSSS